MPERTPAVAAQSHRVLVLNRDRLFSELLRKTIQTLVTTAKILVACSIAEASAALAQDPADVLVTSVFAADGEVLDALPDWIEHRHVVQHALVVTPRKEPYILERLTESPVRGVFDSDGEITEFEHAFAAVASGRDYWSPSIRQAVASGRSPSAPLRNLSQTERLVLAVIGAGYDDAFAADMLRMAPSTVASVRKQVHRKLNVHHRGELMQRAQQYGVVIIDAGQIICPGLSALMATRETRSVNRSGRPRVPLPV